MLDWRMFVFCFEMMMNFTIWISFLWCWERVVIGICFTNLGYKNKIAGNHGLSSCSQIVTTFSFTYVYVFVEREKEEILGFRVFLGWMNLGIANQFLCKRRKNLMMVMYCVWFIMITFNQSMHLDLLTLALHFIFFNYKFSSLDNFVSNKSRG